MTKLV